MAIFGFFSVGYQFLTKSKRKEVSSLVNCFSLHHFIEFHFFLLGFGLKFASIKRISAVFVVNLRLFETRRTEETV
jgi:hypothetical protein